MINTLIIGAAAYLFGRFQPQVIAFGKKVVAFFKKLFGKKTA